MMCKEDMLREIAEKEQHEEYATRLHLWCLDWKGDCPTWIIDGNWHPRYFEATQERCDEIMEKLYSYNREDEFKPIGINKIEI